MPTSDPRGRRTPALVLSLLGLLAAATLLLRTWGLEYDTIHPDDPKQLVAARDFVKGNYLYGLDSPNQYTRGYPFFAMHLIEWTYRGCEQVLHYVAPGVRPPREALSADEFKGYLRRIGLALNCLYELVALGLVYLVGRRLFDPWVGLAAAAVFTVSSLHIQTTHIIGADLPGGLFALGVFFFAVRLRERERNRDWLGAGVCAGLAAAAKYSGVLSLFAPALVYLELRHREGWRSTLSLRSCAGPLAMLAGFVAAFSLATPSVLLAPEDGIAAIRSVLGAAKDFWVPEHYEEKRLAFVVSTWYHPLNGFLRFFEPLPAWLTFVSVGMFVARRRLRASFLWIYPLVLFPVAAYGFPVGVSYHYLGILTPLTWIIGFAVVEALRALRMRWLRIAAALLGAWALTAAASDASIFSLPAASTLTERWLADCAVPARFDLVSPRKARKQIYPRLLGIDFEDFSASARAEREQETAEMGTLAARFELEKRTPTLNHIRNRPHRIHWSDGKKRDIELFPPPRRTQGGREELVFPANLTLGRSPALVSLAPGETYSRRVRHEEGGASWLLYAHYPARALGRGRARLRIAYPGGRRGVRIGKGGDVLIDLDLRRTDLLYNGLFSSIQLRSNEPIFVWLVSPQERGWFLLLMERWRELEAWELGRPGWKSEARLAVARWHLGAGQIKDAAGSVEAALPGFRDGEPAERYKTWTGGVDLGVYAEPQPLLAMERLFVRAADEEELSPEELPPGSRLGGPYEQLVPGFYRVIWEVSGSGGAGLLEYRVTGDSGQRELGMMTSPLPVGRKEVSMPLRITPSSPGWDIEFPIVNTGDAPVRLLGIRLENDPEQQLRWWLGELARALGDGGKEAAPARP